MLEKLKVCCIVFLKVFLIQFGATQYTIMRIIPHSNGTTENCKTCTKTQKIYPPLNLVGTKHKFHSILSCYNVLLVDKCNQNIATTHVNFWLKHTWTLNVDIILHDLYHKMQARLIIFTAIPLHKCLHVLSSNNITVQMKESKTIYFVVSLTNISKWPPPSNISHEFQQIYFIIRGRTWKN